MSRLDEMAAVIPATEVSRVADEPTVAEASALTNVTFYDLYIFLWKLTAALVAFAVPFAIVYLIVSALLRS